MKKNYIFLWAITISFIHVLFLWNWWRYGIEAIGINLTVFWFCVLGFYIYAEKEKLTKKSALWIVPIMLIAVSFSFYATEFSSGISLFTLPWIFFLFTTHQSHANLRKGLWSRYLSITYIFAIGHYIASIFFSIPKTATFYKETYPKKDPNKKHIVTQIITGVSLLFILVGVIIIPLLSSADAEFAKFFKDFLKMISDFFEHINFIFLWKILIAIFLIPTIIALNYYWKKKMPLIAIANKKPKKTDDSIVIGIILGGVLVIYLLFIIIQIKTLFIDNLPINFTDAETLVKSGFWQLIILTLLNIVFYTGAYNKSAKTTQKILSAFTMTSLLLVVSAGQRIYLYVYNYGLSFEKFYALYTVIFCTVIFIWFISLLFKNNKKANIVKTLVFTALWMYSITTVIPLERIIFNTNLKLTQQENSKVNLNELTMLGFDALESVEKNKEIFLREATKDAKLSFKNLEIIEKENIDIEESKKNM